MAGGSAAALFALLYKQVHGNKYTPSALWEQARASGRAGRDMRMYCMWSMHLKAQVPLELCIKNKCMTPGEV